MARLTIELDVPVVARSDEIFKPLFDAAEAELGIIERKFDSVTKTWSSASQPFWQIDKRLPRGKGDGAWTIFTRSTPFVFVSLGTRGGRATFSDNYRPMTRRRVLGSRGRQGRVIAKGRGPRINTEAREFEFAVAEQRQRPFAKKAQRELDRGVKRIFPRKRKGKTVTVI
jgi:hypothetical protein